MESILFKASQPQLAGILNGGIQTIRFKKLPDIRVFPFQVWLCCPRSKPLIGRYPKGYFEINDNPYLPKPDSINGKVVARITIRNAADIDYQGSALLIKTGGESNLTVLRSPLELSAFEYDKVTGRYDTGVKVHQRAVLEKVPSVYCYVYLHS